MKLAKARFALALGLVGVAAFVGAPQALAATDVDYHADLFSSELEIDDQTNDDDNIVVSVAGNTITIVDTGTGGITTTDLDCVLVNATTVTCPLDPPGPDGPVGEVELELDDGTDSFTNQNLVAEVEEDDQGETGNKTINSGPGEDDIETGVGDDVVNLGDGSDTAQGGPGNDRLIGGRDGDDLDGELGNDIAEGGPGDDDIDGEDSFDNGVDLIDGGPGLEDEIEYDSLEGAPGTTQGVTILIDGLPNDGHPGEGDNVIGVEELHGTEGNDRIGGSAAGDEIEGRRGDDQITGGAGDDEIDPEEGNDAVDAGEGADVIWQGSDREDGADAVNGGPGADTVDYDGEEGISFSLNGVADDGRPGEGDNLVSTENADGTEFDDTFVGDSASNTFFAGYGDDTMTGRGGNDAFYGDIGNDVILALGGRDDVNCGLGFDQTVHDAEDVVAGGCERRGAEVASDNTSAAKSGKAKVKVACPAEEGAACKGTLVLVSNGKQLGSGKFSVASGKTGTATVKLTRQGKRALFNGDRRLRVSAEARTTEPQGVSTNAETLGLTAKAKIQAKKKKKTKK